MRKELQSLLDEFDYDKALKWYLAHVEGKFFVKKMLQKGTDRFNVLKLKTELREILKTLPAEPAQSFRAHPVIASVAKQSPQSAEMLRRPKAALHDALAETREELLEEIENLKEQLAKQKPAVKLVDKAAGSREEMLLDEEWKSLYRQANHLFEQINHVTDQATRKDMAFKILDLMDQVEEMWWKKDFIAAHGKLPDFEDRGVDQLTIEQVATRIRTLRTYISKARKGKLNADRIPEWESEMAELERRMRG